MPNAILPGDVPTPIRNAIDGMPASLLGTQWRIVEGPFPTSTSRTCILFQQRQGTAWITVRAFNPDGSDVSSGPAADARLAAIEAARYPWRDFTNLTMSNNWQRYGSALDFSWPPNSICHNRQAKDVRLRGLVSGGTTGNGIPIFPSMGYCGPSSTLVFSVEGGNAHQRIDINSTPTLTAYTTSNGWLSCDGVSWSASYDDAAWINMSSIGYLNNWVDYGAGTGYCVGQFTKDTNGWVRIRGLVKNGTVGAAICVLPPGYRPASRHIFVADCNLATHARVDVLPDGQVFAVSVNSNVYLSLSNIRFHAAGTATYTPLTLGGGCSSYGSGFESPGYFIDDFGIVHLQGLIATTNPGAQALAILQDYACPPAPKLWASCCGNGHNRVDIQDDGRIHCSLAPAGWVSVSGLNFSLNG